MKFKIAIEETVVQTFEVEAETAEEAMNTAEEKYNSGEFVLDNVEVSSKSMAIIEPRSEASNWNAF